MTVLDDAQAALATGPLCDSCLGRLFAERSFGLANAERGHALRVSLALEDDEPFEPTEDCWVCELESERVEWWAEQAATAVRGYEFNTYQVGTKVPPLLEENDALLREDVGLDEDAGEALKTELNREVGKHVGDLTGAEVEFGRPDVQFTLDLATDEVDVNVNSAFVYGRYRKLERDIPQTKWPCNDCNGTGRWQGEPCDGCDGSGFRYDESVEQLSAPVVVEAMDGEAGTFHGAGREDVDALMLESGRPFVIEVDEPRVRDIDVEQLERDINDFADGKVEVESLRLATHEMVERVKELDASKTYRMDVEFDESVTDEALQSALEELEGATIHQDTPQRVSHRRADLTRTRDVYAASGELVDESHADIRIHGAGGLYVKELISSDEGRTEPSLTGLLGVDSVVTALDVVDVQGEDEPFADEEFFRDI
ncbi:tRNA pseudouridine(54/55) synthase Pus10 [Haloarcula salinisoli]|uniref:tRNA pseudouridine synthase Pus10 n=1 Tax=Haloarcula salinisoli TaxID=2487746 RepID=A0A8J7YN41_9EURY|nr:tRNA pseudouridine(54/55) synthase Pus10 [Halomicroarcula salinisoli]MBX0287848.1 tRNA pseudouridine(54/55) synthase Pus10 [Halomicroarcula salinisoli]MBX0304791.1 tRNA pseudouridine(54/55) synthase Pus10 [Halomicroarcula salinisoli]